LNALIVKGDSLTRLGKHNDALPIINEIEELIESHGDLPAKILAYRKSLLLEYKWWFYFTKGELDLVRDTLNQYLTTAKKSGNKRSICAAIAAFAYYHAEITRNLELAAENLDNALVIAEEIDCDYERVRIYLVYTSVHHYSERVEEAIVAANKGLAISEKNDYKTFRPMLYFFLGSIYFYKNDFDLALEYCLKAIAFRSSAGWVIYPLNYIGFSYYIKGDFALAKEYYLKALEICREVDEKRVRKYVLYNLVNVEIQLNKIKEAEQFADNLHEHSKKTKEVFANQLYRFSCALIYKSSSNMQDWIEATKLLKKLLKEEIQHQISFDISFILLEIKLKELQLSPNQSILKELQNQINNLLEKAKQNEYMSLTIEIYRLKSQVALIQFEAKNAIEFLNSAKDLADEYGFKRLNNEIMKDKEKIQKQLNMWQQLEKQKTPLVEILKKAQIDNTVKRITQETILEKRDKKTGEVSEYRKLYSFKI
jgi:tetratricopeptide (TPR) repeat protein